MLDARWIDRIMTKLALAYPGRFPPRAVPVDLLKDEWARELSGLSAEDIKHAMQNLPGDHPPNAIQFKAICHSRPKPFNLPTPIAYTAPTPVQVETNRALVAAFDARKGPGFDTKAWARKLRQREANGEKLSRIQSEYWREALAREMAAERLAEEATTDGNSR